MKEEKAKPKNITLSKGVMDLAEKIMALRRIDDFSGLVQTLIREEYERRHGPLLFTPEPSLEPPAEHASHPERTASRRKRGPRALREQQKR